MKRASWYLFLLLIILGLSGTAQAVPTGGNLLVHPVFENYGSLSGNGVPNMPAFDISWNLSGYGYWSDWFLVTESEAGSFNASVNIGVQPYRDYLCTLPVNDLSCDGGSEGASGNDGYPSGVPEPDTMMLLGSGLLVLAGIGRRFTRT